MKPVRPSVTAPEPLTHTIGICDAFWEGARHGQLLLQVSTRTGKAQFFPRPYGIAACEPMAWKAASGFGVLRAITCCHVPAHGFEALAPYFMGIIQLDEGPRVLARLVHTDPNDFEVGMAMQLAWDTTHAQQPMYVFEGLKK